MSVYRLPLEQPLVNSYPNHACLMAILHQNPDTYAWLFSHYIHLEIPGNLHWARLDYHMPRLWENCPWIRYERLDRATVEQQWGSITAFIRDSLSQGWYTNFVSDHYYLSPSGAKASFRFPHETFVSGIDEERRQVWASDFFRGTFQTLALNIEELEQAYDNVDLDRDWLFGVERYRLAQWGCRNYYIAPVRYRLNLPLIRDSLQHYVSGANIAALYHTDNGEHKRGYSFGLRVYDRLIGHLDDVLRQKTVLNYESFHMLYDHKRLMMKRLDYLEIQGCRISNFIKGLFMGIERDALIVRNNLLKYRFNKDEAQLKSIQDRLRMISDKERSGYISLYNALNVPAQPILQEQPFHVSASSVSLNADEGPERIIDGNPDTFYASGLHPELPQSIELRWKSPITFDRIELSCFDGPQTGITALDIEIFSEYEGWVRVAGCAGFVYEDGLRIKESMEILLDEPIVAEGLRIIVREANRKPVFIINELKLGIQTENNEGS